MTAKARTPRNGGEAGNGNDAAGECCGATRAVLDGAEALSKVVEREGTPPITAAVAEDGSCCSAAGQTE